MIVVPKKPAPLQQPERSRLRNEIVKCGAAVLHLKYYIGDDVECLSDELDERINLLAIRLRDIADSLD